MTFRGTVQNGRVLFDTDADLPNGTRVDIRPIPKPRKSAAKPKARGLLRLARHAIRTGIRDLADEHDHDVYGTPKRTKAKRSRAKRK